MKLAAHVALVVLFLTATPAPTATAEAPAWAQSEIQRHIPADAPVVLLARAPAELFEQVGWPKLVRKYTDTFRAASERSLAIFGKDLLIEAAWKSFGIDLRKPAGISLTETQGPSGAFWLSVHDERALETFLAAKAGDKLSRRTVGAATVLDVDGPVRFVIWKGIVALVFGDDLDEAGLDALADRFAGLEGDQSLAGNPRWLEIERQAGAKDAAGLVDLRGIVSEELDRDAARRAEDKSWAESELESAKRDGAAPDRIADLEKSVEIEKADRARYAARNAREAAFVRSFFDGVEGITFGVSLDGAVFGVQASVRLKEGDRVRAVLKNGAPLTLTRALTEPPMFLLEGLTDPAALAQAFRDFIDAEETDGFEGAKKAVQESFGLDLNKDVFELMSGTFGFALSGIRKGTSHGFDIGASGGLSSEAAAKRSHDVLADSDAGVLRRDGASYVWEQGRDFARLAINALRLNAASQDALLDRLGSTKVQPVKLGGLTPLLGAPGIAAALVFDAASIVFGLGSDYYPESENERPVGDSPQAKALLSKLEALEKKRAAARERRATERQKHAATLAKLAGQTAVTATVTSQGLTMKGGQYFGGKTIAATLDLIFADAAKASKSTTKDRAAEAAIEAQIDAVTQQLQDLPPPP